MADFELKLQHLSERGNPVGAEELIERIEAELAGNPIVVVAKQRKGIFMTKTDESTRTEHPNRSRVIGWAVAAVIAIVVAVGVYWASAPNTGNVVDTVTTASTTTSPPEALSALEVIEAGVAAFYSGDGDQAAELFELSDFDDDRIRGGAAYQAAIGGRLTLSCNQKPAAGELTCRTPYHNALTDVTGTRDSGDTADVSVRDGVIVEFPFPEHSWILHGIGTYLAMEGRFQEYEGCMFVDTYPPSCAAIQIENVDAWNDWRLGVDALEVVELAIEGWYGGDCEVALFMVAQAPLCSSPFATEATMSIEYEAVLGAQVTLQGCTVTNPTGYQLVNCEVHYSNVMSAAVGNTEAVIVKDFEVFDTFVGDWFLSDYPEDIELRESFRAFAESGELADEYAAADCAAIDQRTPECATLIVDNLEAWATWYESNG